VSRVGDIALAFMSRGGKRLRPRLCRAAYVVASRNAAEPAGLEKVLTAVECFHKASLIHDDIQDGDEVRYDRPAVWVEHGVPVAIAVGDWLVAHGYRLIAESGLPQASAMIAAVAASHLNLCAGQGEDLLCAAVHPPARGVVGRAFDPAGYVAMCRGKTGEPFALAAHLGALAAGVEDGVYRTWGELFGILFQVRDDLADGAEPEILASLQAEWEGRFAEMRARLPGLYEEAFGA